MTGLPKSVGFIGGGNMAEALLRGLLEAGLASDQLIVAEPLEARRARLQESFGVRTANTNADALAGTEVVVLAVKPQHLEAALADLAPGDASLFLSIVAGARSQQLRALLGPGARVVRSMPNTPALIGAGITAIASDAASEVDLDRAEAVLRAVGRVVRVPEALMDAVTGLSGSGPAYVYVIIEALTEAGVREGLPLEVARELAAWTVRGAAQMISDSDDSPATLKERVASPGGTTIAGLAALEAAGLRAALFAAVQAATARSRELAQD